MLPPDAPDQLLRDDRPEPRPESYREDHALGETLPEPSLALVRKIFWRNNVIALAPLYSLRVRTGDRVAPLVAEGGATSAYSR